jgi:hypothetical protein
MVSLAIPLLLSALLAASARGDETLVTVAQGALRGEITPDGLARAFRGIPYATPPTGGERPRIRPLASSPSPLPPLTLAQSRARSAPLGAAAAGAGVERRVRGDDRRRGVHSELRAERRDHMPARAERGLPLPQRLHAAPRRHRQAAPGARARPLRASPCVPRPR